MPSNWAGSRVRSARLTRKSPTPPPAIGVVWLALRNSGLSG
jgi:hypothetical protein